MIYYLRVHIYRGVAPGAEHYWSVLETYNPEESPSVKTPFTSLLCQYKTHEEALNSAINWFMREHKKGDFLLLSPQTVRDVLDRPEVGRR